MEQEDTRFLFPVLREIYGAKKWQETHGTAKNGLPLALNAPVETWRPECLVALPMTISTSVPASLAPAAVALPPCKELPSTGIISLQDLCADEQGPFYGQKVTASWKPLTHITKEWVYKGPYVQTRSDIPQQVLNRYKRFQEYGDTAALAPIMVKNASGQCYLRFPNVGKHWPPKVSAVVAVKTGSSTILGRIVDRNSMGVWQGQELIERGEMDWPRILYHLMIRSVLNIGDSGYWNIINNYGIDYEEERGTPKTPPQTLMEMLFAKPPAASDKEATEAALGQYRATLRERLLKMVLPHTQSPLEWQRTQQILQWL